MAFVRAMTGLQSKTSYRPGWLYLETRSLVTTQITRNHTTTPIQPIHP